MINYHEPIYDPFSDRGPTYYHPANDAAVHLVAIQLIYRDISQILDLHNASKVYYTQKLLSKYAIVEIVSLIDHVVALANTVISGRVGFKIGHDELVKAKEPYGAFKDVQKKYSSDLTAVRNQLGAHRDSLDLLIISKLWDKINGQVINEVLSTVGVFFNHFKDLNVYTWTKTSEDGLFAFIQPLNPGELEFASKGSQKTHS